MKKVVIVCYSEYAAMIHKQTLERIFGPDLLDISWWLLSEPAEQVQADLLILISAGFQDYVRYCFGDTPTIVASYTLERKTVQKIREISRTSKLCLASYTSYEILRSRKALLGDMGVDTGQLQIWDRNREPTPPCRHVICFGDQVPEGAEELSLIHISSRLLSIGTVMEIACALQLNVVDCQARMIDYYRDVCPLHSVSDYEVISNGTSINMLSGRSDPMVKFTDRFRIYYCNDAAKDLLDLPMSGYMDRPVTEIFPFLKEYDLPELEHTEEQVVSFRDRLHVAHLEIAKMHGVRIGTLYLSDYWTIQKHHDKLERQMNRKQHRAKYSFLDLVGNSAAMKDCKRLARKMAQSNENILIQGESGAGKELFAQAIHNCSDRRDHAFVAINCGALVDSLMESELFGYEEGAFTGARKGGHQGSFEVANRGTLFLDEIGELPLNMQTKLLRVLQEREIVRVGGNEEIPIDVRVIAATHQDLKKMVAEKKFRADLYYRLVILPLHIPSLDQRAEDIPLLAEYLREKKGYSYTFTREAMDCMQAHHYEGNVRELENCLSYCAILQKPVIEREDLPASMQDGTGTGLLPPPPTPAAIQVTERKVLEIIDAINRSGQGAGRRSVRESLSREGGAPVPGEAEIRRMMEKLHRAGLITSSSGRGGSRITEAGQRILNAH